MNIVFSNVHFDGDIQSKSDMLLRIVGDFAIIIGDRRLYEEAEFCLVEFAVALSNWLAKATTNGPDFVYTSVESEAEGLVRFRLRQPGAWRISAAHQHYDEHEQFTTEQVTQAACAYIHELRAALLPTIDLLDHLDEEAQRAVRACTWEEQVV